MSTPHILLVEDDASLATWIADYLTNQGYDITLATNGIDAVTLIRDDQPDLVLLDVNLPGKDGFDVCREVRVFYHRPILIMTARLEETDEVLGLEMGADDYITKPVRPRALLARIKGLLKRELHNPVPDVASDQKLRLGALVIDATARTTTLHDEPVRISSNEFDVLWYLASHAGTIVTREQLLKDVRGLEYDGFDRSMDVLVSRIRKKLGSAEHPDRIKTVWGKGYLLVTDAWS
ncbi:transcriptional regulatory protein RstA [Reinekea sp. MED297]|uniref:Transcriptional regulatory protein RstA n=1 Tax=Reinekea blandensis MED297 TaxID=314283 RepID=A4BAD2_9GAMM|nr:transcriptional regulatory protein RstA [Reinekea sp. MED297] [Reinekea blandensis MED297]